jgi:hypothetical protein
MIVDHSFPAVNAAVSYLFFFRPLKGSPSGYCLQLSLRHRDRIHAVIQLVETLGFTGNMF